MARQRLFILDSLGEVRSEYMLKLLETKNVIIEDLVNVFEGFIQAKTSSIIYSNYHDFLIVGNVSGTISCAKVFGSI